MWKQGHEVPCWPSRVCFFLGLTVLEKRTWSQSVGRRTGRHQTGGVSQHSAQRLFNRSSDEEHRDLRHLEPVHLLKKPQPRASQIRVCLACRETVVRTDHIMLSICTVDGHARWTFSTPFEASVKPPSCGTRSFYSRFPVVDSKLQNASPPTEFDPRHRNGISGLKGEEPLRDALPKSNHLSDM